MSKTPIPSHLSIPQLGEALVVAQSSQGPPLEGNAGQKWEAWQEYANPLYDVLFQRKYKPVFAALLIWQHSSTQTAHASGHESLQ